MNLLKVPIFRTPYWFWGTLDALLIVGYLQACLRSNRIPYVTEALDAARLAMDFGLPLFAYTIIGLVAHASVIVSAALLLKKRRSGIYLSLFQVPFRLVFVIPSFSLLMVWAKFSPGYSGWLMLALLPSSEIAKTRSLWRLLKSERAKDVIF